MSQNFVILALNCRKVYQTDDSLRDALPSCQHRIEDTLERGLRVRSGRQGHLVGVSGAGFESGHLSGNGDQKLA